MDEGRAAALARHQGDHGGEVAARAVTSDGDAARVDPEPGGVRHHPLERGVRVVGRHGVLELRREAVVHAGHRAPRRVGRATGRGRRGCRGRRSPSPRRGSRPGPDAVRGPPGEYARTVISPPATGTRWSATAATSSKGPRAAVRVRSDSRASSGVDSSTGLRLSAAMASMTRWAWGSSGIRRPPAVGSSAQAPAVALARGRKSLARASWICWWNGTRSRTIMGVFSASPVWSSTRTGPSARRISGRRRLKVVEVVDDGCHPVAGALGHHDEVDRQAARDPLRARRVVHAVLEEEVDEVPGRGARDRGEGSELHEQGAVAVEHDHAAVGAGERHPEPEGRGASHEPDARHGQIAGREASPGGRGGHGRDDDGVAALGGDGAQDVLRLVDHLRRHPQAVSSPTRTAAGPRRARLRR